MCVSLEARREVARVEPSNQAPVVRASRDDEIEARVRASARACSVRTMRKVRVLL